MGDPPGQQWMDEHFRKAAPTRSQTRRSPLATAARGLGWLTLLLGLAAGGWGLAEYYRLIDTGWWPWDKVPLEQETIAAAPDEAPPATIAVDPEPATLDPGQRRLLENRRTRLTEGVRLLTKDLGETEASLAPFAAQMQAASARVQQLEDYARTTPMTAKQQADYRIAHHDAVADHNNSQGRAKELSDKRDSLRRRLDQAKADLVSVDRQLGQAH